MNTPTPPAPARRQRLALIGLFALFLGPIAAAWFLYNHLPEWQPTGTVNQGVLVQPPRPVTAGPLLGRDGSTLSVAALRGRWTLVMMAVGVCRDGCERRLHELRQLHAGLNKDIERVRRILLVVGPEADSGFAVLGKTFPDLVLARGDGASLAPWLQQFVVGQDAAPERSGRVFLIDPQGNLMMLYSPDSPTQGILKDVRRLLKLSQVG